MTRQVGVPGASERVDPAGLGREPFHEPQDSWIVQLAEAFIELGGLDQQPEPGLAAEAWQFPRKRTDVKVGGDVPLQAEDAAADDGQDARSQRPIFLGRESGECLGADDSNAPSVLLLRPVDEVAQSL